ncbi:hybrid sensor histidine kinase/response regulator [Curvibacter delicatus]|jgi:signal transduction histidine kinase|uniref:hybrid sensor histidine kinase/response regulator n=1 Tax=Curvibacter delicatus TaxID=80879 RepID=UPI00082F2BBF|nr:ATP-binding protein [Curvibacter delicatus]
MPPAPLRPIRILHLEDSVLDHDLVARTLVKAGLSCDMRRVERLDEFLSSLQTDRFDVILADYRLPGFTALDAWQALREHPQRPPFILLSGAIGESAAVEAIKLGISDYLLKDDMGKLPHVIHRALEVQEAHLAKERADAELAASEQRLAHFADHLQMTIEQERAAIAREIHDDIGGSLAAIKFDLSWLGRHYGTPDALAHIESALGMLQHALGASQRIMLNLRPAILDQGLEAAVDWLAREFESRTGIRTLFRANLKTIDLSKPVQLAAYRTAQEALTNISKHAQCSEVRIELSDAEDVLTLEIADNGRGIQPTEREKPKAFGLKGLQERARSVGGWLDVSSRSGEGTAITLTIPLSNPPAGHSQDGTS